MAADSAFMRGLRLIDRAIGWIEASILIFGIFGMAATNIANVLSRNLLNQSLTFTQEVNQSLIVLVTFVGLGYGVRHARHIRMSAVYDQLQGVARKSLMVLMSLVTALLCFVLAWYAFVYAGQVYDAGAATPALRMPLWWVMAFVPVGFVLGGIQYLLAAIRNLISADTWLSFDQKDEYTDVANASDAVL